MNPLPAAGTNQIEIVVNGKPGHASAGISIEGLLRQRGVDMSRVAVELDRQIVRRAEWPSTFVTPGARVEIVQFVGGG